MPVLLKVRQGADQRQVPLSVKVLYSDATHTAAALQAAAILAHGLGLSIQMIVVRVVPYPLPLTSPAAAIDFTERQVEAVAQAAGVAASVQVCYGRDREDLLMKLLPEHSVVVMSSGPRWLPNRQSRLARFLRREGHEVVLINAK